MFYYFRIPAGVIVFIVALIYAFTQTTIFSIIICITFFVFMIGVCFGITNWFCAFGDFRQPIPFIISLIVSSVVNFFIIIYIGELSFSNPVFLISFIGSTALGACADGEFD